MDSRQKVHSPIRWDRGVRIPDEEVAYLALHIARAAEDTHPR